jgi:hypothetical protein
MTQATTVTASSAPARAAAPNPRLVTSTTRAVAPAVGASDDEILGIVSPRKDARRDAEQLALDFDADTTGVAPDAATGTNSSNAQTTSPAAANPGEPEKLRAVFDANPELRSAWQDAGAYRESFATPQAAREANRTSRGRESDGRTLFLAPPGRSRRACAGDRRSRSRVVRITGARDWRIRANQRAKCSSGL